MSNDILVFAEIRDGSFKKINAEQYLQGATGPNISTMSFAEFLAVKNEQILPFEITTIHEGDVSRVQTPAR